MQRARQAGDGIAGGEQNVDAAGEAGAVVGKLREDVGRERRRRKAAHAGDAGAAQD